MIDTSFIPSRASRDGLIARARMFRLRGPLSVDAAWDGIALAEYAHRERLYLPQGWGRQIDRAVKVITASNTITAFKMCALSAVTLYHLSQLQMVLDFTGRDDDLQQMRKAWTDLVRARRQSRRKAA